MQGPFVNHIPLPGLLVHHISIRDYCSPYAFIGSLHPSYTLTWAYCSPYTSTKTSHLSYTSRCISNPLYTFARAFYLPFASTRASRLSYPFTCAFYLLYATIRSFSLSYVSTWTFCFHITLHGFKFNLYSHLSGSCVFWAQRSLTL